MYTHTCTHGEIYQFCNEIIIISENFIIDIEIEWDIIVNIVDNYSLERLVNFIT